MDNTLQIKAISQIDLIKSGCLDFKSIINVIEEAFIEFEEDKVIFPDKLSLIFNEEFQDRINFLPAAIKNKNIYGMKWVSVFPRNPLLFNKPNLSAVVLLSELESGYPVALLEAGLLTNMRTAAVGAIGAKYFARKDSEVIGIIGAGNQGKSHLLSMKAVCPNLKVCKIADKYPEFEESFIDQMSSILPDVTFIKCNSDYEKAATGSDIIVTAISGQEKILQGEWISEGAFYCHVAGLEDDFSVPLKASKIVCDDWYTVKHRTQTISQMYRQGLLQDSDIYANLNDVISGRKSGRENDSEFVYFNSVGLSFLDIKVAIWMYEKCLKTEKYTLIDMKNESMFDDEFNNDWVF